MWCFLLLYMSNEFLYGKHFVLLFHDVSFFPQRLSSNFITEAMRQPYTLWSFLLVFCPCVLFSRFLSFCRVGTGLSDEERDALVTKLKPYFRYSALILMFHNGSVFCVTMFRWSLTTYLLHLKALKYLRNLSYCAIFGTGKMSTPKNHQNFMKLQITRRRGQMFGSRALISKFF